MIYKIAVHCSSCLKRPFLSCFVFLAIADNATAQTKIYDHNAIGWVQLQNLIKLQGKNSAHVEFNWRRVNGLANHAQSLLRLGVNHQVDNQLTLHVGYAYADTHVFGDYPIAANGNFEEHRIYEQVNLKQAYAKVQLTHRLRIEQRWVEVNNTAQQHDRWNFVHRFRYQLKAARPIGKKFTAAASNEIFIGAGKNLGVNIFDQNRIYLSASVKLSKQVSVEAGYLNVVQQQGRLVNNKLVVQRNNGVLLTISTNL